MKLTITDIPAGRLLIGLSGGVDSVVLLHLLHQLSPRPQLSAIHVHHGISPNADRWAEFCQQLCAQYEIPLIVERVDIKPLRHMGIEAAARKQRHAAFARQPCDWIVLAHHADDQVETLCLQLLRGAGVKGAGAMSVLQIRQPLPNILRPMLHLSRFEIENYARQHQLSWVDDESNADISYPRNFLRHQVLPVLEQKFPAYRATMARSAQHFKEAASLLDELASADIQLNGPVVSLEPLQQLSLPRAKNALRYFLQQNNVEMPQQVQLEEVAQQILHARQDAQVCVAFGDYELRRHKSQIYLMRRLPAFDKGYTVSWQGQSCVDWPALNGKLNLQKHCGGVSIDLAKLEQASVVLRLRQGGETMRLQPNGKTRTLKNLYQEHDMPSWQRERAPLLFCGDELVWAWGLGVNAKYQATAGLQIDLIC